MDIPNNTFVTELLKMNDEYYAGDDIPYAFIRQEKKGAVVFTKQLACIDEIYVQVVDHPQEVNDILHSNDFFELLYAPSGNISIEINGRKETLSGDEILFLNKNVVYKVDSILSGDELLWHVFINEALFDDDFFNLVQENNVFSLFIVKSMFLSNMYRDCLRTRHIDKHVAMILELLRAQIEQEKSNQKILTAYFSILFNKLNHFENNLIETDEFIHYYKRNAQILKIVGYIRQNYKTADLRSVAENVHIHANYLCSLVKTTTGKTFSEMLNGIKMQAARHMLESTEDSIESVSCAVGYDNPSYFYKLFKKTFGMTPKEYRENGGQKQKRAAAYTRSIYAASHNDISYLMSRKLIYNGSENPRIAFMPMGTELNYYMISIGNGLIAGLHSKRVDIFTAAPKSTADSQRQNEILRDVIEQKPHGIIICTHDLQVAAPLFKKAIDTGIVICLINHDNAQLPVPVHAVVGYRQKEATRRMGAYVGDKLGAQRIKAGIIRGVHGYHSTQRFSGFLEPLIDRENFDIISIQYGRWNEKSGFDAALSMLSAHAEINLIFAENDHQAMGAIRAARQLGRQDVRIVGHDGAISGLRHVVSGDLFATTDTHPVEMGNMAIMSVLNCLEGNITGGFIETPADIVDKRNVVSALVNHEPGA